MKKALLMFGVGCLGSGIMIGSACTPAEKGVVRTVVDVVRAVCTPEDTTDACIDKVLADKSIIAARKAKP